MRCTRPDQIARPFAAGLVAALALAASGCGASAGTSSTTAPPSRSTTTSSSTTSSPSSTDTSSGTGTSASSGTSPTSSLPGTGKPVVTIGDKNYTEQFVLGQLYLQALQAQGFTVNLNDNIGPTDVTLQALKTGTLAMYPEYLNIFNNSIAGYRHSFRTSLAAYTAAEHYALAHGLELLTPTPFSDTYAVAVTVAYAAANRLRTIGDLRRVQASLTVGGPPQFQQDAPGLPQLKRAYGVAPAGFKSLAVGDQYAALNAGTVQAADANTTDGALASGDYMLLRDPRRVFGWGNVVPVISAKLLNTEGPAFAATIERVDATLTTSTMRELNQAVDIANQSPATVAKQFLQTHGLLTPQAA
ncbi:MAG: glycine betaine ABC transporter substrate-binding protein [Solirubrobacteraceae bacterium]